ncbi:hypothetical protein [Jiangella gansuensis]|uniref:hypothetical protein n=1 Tax=Jiangella gansuensis TaxID=281473 RepID=UPI0004B2315C|nr:hypothetical protein [Jiangella gansuensis]
MSRRGVKLATLTAVAALAACSSPAEEPAGLSDPTTTESTPADADPTDSEPAETPRGDDEPPATEPSDGFTQPFLPDGQESVIELAPQLPVEIPGDATAEEEAVLEVVGRFMAAWDAILFGADPETARLAESATNPQLGRLVQYSAESVLEQRVTVGEPTVIEVRDVSVDGTTAEVDACITMANWVQYVRGEPEPLDAVERQVLTVENVDGRWLVSNSTQKGATACS